MSSRDPLVARFAALRAEVPSTPPGVEAARRTVATWRRRRLVGALAALALATSGIAVLAAQASGTPQVATTPSSSAPTFTEPLPTASSQPAGPGAGTAGSPGTGSTTSGAGRSPGSPTPCTPSLTANVTKVVGVQIEVSLAYPKPRCPNERVRVFWASYTIDEAGVQHLFRSGTASLDPANPTVQFVAVMPTQCRSRILYVAQGSAAIPSTITTGTDMMKVDPFRVPRPGVGNFLWSSDPGACPSPSPSG